jgi:hypothetical protein
VKENRLSKEEQLFYLNRSGLSCHEVHSEKGAKRRVFVPNYKGFATILNEN